MDESVTAATNRTIKGERRIKAGKIKPVCKNVLQQLTGNSSRRQLKVKSSHVSLRVSRNNDHKQVGRKKRFSLLTIIVSLLAKELRAGTQGKNLESGTDVKTMKESCLLACANAQQVFLQHTETSVQAWPGSEWAGISHINH